MEGSEQRRTPLLATAQPDIELSTSASPPIPDTTGKAWTYVLNVVLLGAGFFGIFLPFNATQTLESTINAKLGQWSVSTLYFSFTFSSIFAAPISRALGPKYSMALGGLTYVGYMIANLWPGWASLLISAAFLGLGAAVLWTGEGVYLTTCASSYSVCKRQELDRSLGLFNGIFYFMMQLNSSLGNAIGAIVLMSSDGDTKFLFYIFIGIASLGVLILLFLRSAHLPEYVEPTDRPKVSAIDNLFETLRLLGDPRMYLLAPMITYSGLALGFVTGQYTSLAIEASLGERYWIGFVMSAFYISDTVFSISLGKLSDRIGRLPIMCFGAVCQAIVLIYLIQWDVSPGAYPALFTLAALYGAGDAAWQTQLSAYLGVYFPKQTEAAFANFKLWQSAGMGIIFFYGPYLTLQLHSMVVGGVLVVSFASYILLTRLPQTRPEEMVTLEAYTADAS